MVGVFLWCKPSAVKCAGLFSVHQSFHDLAIGNFLFQRTLWHNTAFHVRFYLAGPFGIHRFRMESQSRIVVCLNTQDRKSGIVCLNCPPCLYPICFLSLRFIFATLFPELLQHKLVIQNAGHMCLHTYLQVHEPAFYFFILFRPKPEACRLHRA